MFKDILTNVVPLLFFFLGTLLALGVSFMLERYRK